MWHTVTKRTFQLHERWTLTSFWSSIFLNIKLMTGLTNISGMKIGSAKLRKIDFENAMFRHHVPNFPTPKSNHSKNLQRQGVYWIYVCLLTITTPLVYPSLLIFFEFLVWHTLHVYSKRRCLSILPNLCCWGCSGSVVLLFIDEHCLSWCNELGIRKVEILLALLWNSVVLTTWVAKQTFLEIWYAALNVDLNILPFCHYKWN